MACPGPMAPETNILWNDCETLKLFAISCDVNTNSVVFCAVFAGEWDTRFKGGCLVEASLVPSKRRSLEKICSLGNISVGGFYGHGMAFSYC